MTDKLNNPHDKFFKDIFTQRPAAQSFLQNYLPAPVLALLDLDSLDIRQGSFVDTDLQEHHTDLLYEVALQDETPLYIYLLFEHKSYPDDQVVLQLLDYMLRIWKHDQDQNRPLRAIMSLVLYHGDQRWRVREDFASLFNLPEPLRPYFPDFRYELFDLSQYEDAQIQGTIFLKLSLMLLKYSRSDELRKKLFEMVDLWEALSKQETGLEMLRTMFIYLSRGTDKVVKEDLMSLSGNGLKRERSGYNGYNSRSVD